MVTTDTRTVGDAWKDEHAGEQTGGAGDIAALIHKATAEPSKAAQDAAQGYVVNATDLFPDDQWDETPYLDKELERAMLENGSPFFILGVMGRDSEFGPIFKVVIEIEQGLVFSVVFSYDERYRSRNEKLAKVGAMLLTGAPKVGPFVLTSTDPDDPKAFKSFKSYRAAVTAEPDDKPRKASK